VENHFPPDVRDTIKGLLHAIVRPADIKIALEALLRESGCNSSAAASRH
jgi:hypothetical protein